MRLTLFVWLTSTLLVSVAPAHAQSAPRATYAVTARATDAVDDVVEGVSYLRVQLTIVTVAVRQSDPTMPSLGPGSTLTAIVRDPAQRSILRALTPAQTIALDLGWFDQSTYQVLSVLNQPVSSAVTSAAAAPARATTVMPAIALVGVTVLAGVILFYLHEHAKAHRG